MDGFDSQSNIIDQASVHHSLVFVAHAHRPPLTPGPDLKFDLRKISNPPKHIRDAYDGRSKRLRDHMLADGAFVKMLDAAQLEVKDQIALLISGDTGSYHPKQVFRCCGS